jgi:hypothetical protein
LELEGHSSRAITLHNRESSAPLRLSYSLLCALRLHSAVCAPTTLCCVRSDYPYALWIQGTRRLLEGLAAVSTRFSRRVRYTLLSSLSLQCTRCTATRLPAREFTGCSQIHHLRKPHLGATIEALNLIILYITGFLERKPHYTLLIPLRYTVHFVYCGLDYF